MPVIEWGTVAEWMAAVCGSSRGGRQYFLRREDRGIFTIWSIWESGLHLGERHKLENAMHFAENYEFAFLEREKHSTL